MSRTEYLKDILVKKIINKNWPGAEVKDVQFGDKKGGNPSDGGFASDSFKLKIMIEDNGKIPEEFYFITKVPPENDLLKKLQSSDKLFDNETVWYEKLSIEYEKIIKNAGLDINKYRVWPKSYLCDKYSNDLAVIVMEDLQKDGFRLSDSEISLDESHAILSLKKLGIFHALGFTFKYKNPDSYKELLDEIQEAYYGLENQIEQDGLLKPTVERGIKALRTKPEYKEYVALLDEKLRESPFMYQKNRMQRDGANNILCHGDFLRNNILFNYKESGEVKDAILIDFATIRKSSPALDLALFIYMSVDEKILSDRNYLKKLLSVYHATVVSTLQLLNGPADPWNGDINNLEKEFGSYVLYAYNICSFFMGVMLVKDFSLDEMMKLTPEEQVEMNINIGGPIITQRLINILISFKNNGYDKYL